MYKEISLSATVGACLASSAHDVPRLSALAMLWLVVMMITLLTSTMFVRGFARQMRARGQFGE